MTFQDLAEHDITVSGVLKNGGTLEDCVIALHSLLVSTNQRLALANQRILELERIAPAAIIYNGDRYVRQCPQELIPIVEIDEGGL